MQKNTLERLSHAKFSKKDLEQMKGGRTGLDIPSYVIETNDDGPLAPSPIPTGDPYPPSGPLPPSDPFPPTEPWDPGY